jgi:putative transposase
MTGGYCPGRSAVSAFHVLVNSLKGVSSRCLRQRFEIRTQWDGLWSPSYFAASAGAPLSIIRPEAQRRPA